MAYAVGRAYNKSTKGIITHSSQTKDTAEGPYHPQVQPHPELQWWELVKRGGRRPWIP